MAVVKIRKSTEWNDQPISQKNRFVSLVEESLSNWDEEEVERLVGAIGVALIVGSICVLCILL